jgi:hypothetical protein
MGIRARETDNAVAVAASGNVAVERPPSRAAVVISSHPEPDDVLDSVFFGLVDADVIVVSPAAGGYSCIKRVKPDSVVLLIGIDDESACQLLTMLCLDSKLAGLRVVICVTDVDASPGAPVIPGPQPGSRPAVAARLN